MVSVRPDRYLCLCHVAFVFQLWLFGFLCISHSPSDPRQLHWPETVANGYPRPLDGQFSQTTGEVVVFRTKLDKKVTLGKQKYNAY